MLRAGHIANIEFGSWDNLDYLDEKDPTDLRSLAWLDPSNDSNLFAHIVRASIRQEEWSTVSARRASFNGMCYGVDRAATLELHKQLGGLNRYHLRCVLTGANATALQRHRRNKELSPLCRCCGAAVESLEHLVDECETLAHIRYGDMTPTQWFALPNCLRYHGIVPSTLEGTAMDRKQAGCLVQHVLLDMWQHVRSFDVDAPPPVARWKRRRVE